LVTKVLSSVVQGKNSFKGNDAPDFAGEATTSQSAGLFCFLNDEKGTGT